MIIKRNIYYYVSTQAGLEKTIINPSIPNNFLTRGKFIDWKLKRIRLYRTIEEAISGLYLGEKFKDGTKIYVYQALGIDKNYLHGPKDILEVPYAMKLKEYWYTKDLRLSFLGFIIVKEKGVETYKYGPKQQPGKIYKWAWYEERKYSILSDLQHSGIKRTYKKSVGRLRRLISEQISKSMARDRAMVENAEKNLKTIKMNFRPEVAKNLENIAQKNKSGIKYIPELNMTEGITGKTSNFIDSLKVDPSNKLLVSTLEKDAANGIENQIFVKGPESSAVVAHELGHIKSNSKDPKRYTKASQSRSILSYPKEDILNGEPVSLGPKQESGIEKTKRIKRLLTHVSRAYPEEVRANRFGLSYLRKAGASKEELSTAKDLYNQNKAIYKADFIVPKEALREKYGIKRYLVEKLPDGTITRREISTSYMNDLNRLSMRKGRRKGNEY